MRQLFLILTASLILTVGTTWAQTDTTIKKSKYHFWMNDGIQYFLSDNSHSLIGVQLGLNSSIYQRHFIKLKGYAGLSSSGTSLTISQPDRLATIVNLSLLYGIGKYVSRSFAIVPSIGPSYGSAFWRGEYLYSQNGGLAPDMDIYDDDKYNYVGLNIEFTCMWTTPFIGASIAIYANIHKHSDYGVAVCYLLGKIRDKN